MVISIWHKWKEKCNRVYEESRNLKMVFYLVEKDFIHGSTIDKERVKHINYLEQ